MKNLLHIHRSVENDANRWQRRQQLELRLQLLVAHSHPGIVKGCQGNGNQHWLRSPLGGGSTGMQYYLWWTRKRSILDELKFGPNSILIRAIRKHDTHAPLTAGNADDYHEFRIEDFSDEKSEHSPWTPKQRDFVSDGNPIRILHGVPGSGKTMALWRAVETLSNQQVLYLTWSSRLAERAQERFAAFAPNNLVTTRYFTQFLGEICRYDIKNPSFREIREGFFNEWRINKAQLLGSWANREYALYAEMRAFLLGRAILGEDNSIGGPVARLSNDKYLELRGTGKTGVGPNAARAFLTIVKAIEKQRKLDNLFPELAAATSAITRLRDNDLPEGFAKFNQIVIDEIQDLTLLEITVILELREAIRQKCGQAPGLWVAGDESQIVRPSGFDWARLKEKLDNPREIFLERNLRCPANIDAVIGQIRRFYTEISKAERPGDQKSADGTQPAIQSSGNLFHVQADDKNDTRKLLKELVDMTDVAVISMENHDYGNMWTPETAKGLEYQSVCVLNPGRLLKTLKAEAEGDADDLKLEEHARRSSIDQLRVALSRATETLAFIDIEAGDEEHALSRELLGKENGDLYTLEEFVEHFGHASPEARIYALMERSQDCLEKGTLDRPGRGSRGCQRFLQNRIMALSMRGRQY